MATDATGTPTSPDLIPTYNTSVDAPSGLGFNAAMAQIQVALIAKMSIPAGLLSGETIVYNGASFDRSSVTKLSVSGLSVGTAGQVLTTSGGVAIWGAGGTTSRSVAPPGAPADGDIWYYVDSLTATTVEWAFRWNAGSVNTDKWEFIGGSALVSQTGTTGTVTNVAYTDPTTLVSLTIPRAGVYRVLFGGTMFHAVGSTQVAHLALKKGAAATADTESINPSGRSIPTANGPTYGAREIDITFAAADVVKMQAKIASGTVNIDSQYIRVEPIRVS